MSYVAPYISAAGLTIPSYADILSFNLGNYQGSYGQNIYLGIDSSDYQWISAFSLCVADVMTACQLVYNSRGPLTAIGAALDGIIKMNGLVRLAATPSTCSVVITGTPGVLIAAGTVRDVNGYLWDLPANTTIGGGGTVTVIVTAEQPGAIQANPGDISAIATPTAGWTGVNNASIAIVGTPVESDYLVRARQSISVALPSKTRLAGTIAGIAQTTGVTRYNVLENPTAVVDAFGNPPHSITAVVEGGTTADVATTIYNNKGPGCATNGTTSYNVPDSVSGFLTLIAFDRPTYVPIFVVANIHPLTGFTSATLLAIQTAITTYLNSLQIGFEVPWGEIIAAALSARTDPQTPTFTVNSLFIGLAAGPTGTANIPVTFFSVAQGVPANVVVNSV